MGWTVTLAEAVLRECQSGGFYNDPIPISGDETIQLAQDWYQEAKKEADRGVKHPTVIAIVNLVEGQLEQQGNTAIADNGKVEESDPELAATSDLDKLALEHRLPLPQEFDGEPSLMPRDSDDITDKQIRRLSLEYNSYLGRAKWLLAIAQSDLANATHLRDRALRKAFKVVHEELVKKEQRPTKDIVASLAEENEEVVEWNGRVKEHQNHVTAYKALVEIYGGNVERLSREATLRQYEWERSK